MLTIYRFFKGYLKIKFSGEKGEKLLNIFANNSLNTWNMIYDSGYITGCIDIKSFKKLKNLKTGSGIKVKVLSKHGLPFFVNKNKNRCGILVGFAIFLIIIKFLSSYIWYIDIIGNNRISNTEILKICNEIGIKEGIKSNLIDSKNDANKIILANKEIAWASLNVEGCKLTVNISETEENTYTGNLPSNIKAKADGIITKIKASNGETVVKIGDTVRKGDVLISGVKSSAQSTIFLQSIGEIYAKTTRVYKEYKPFNETIKLTKNKTHNKSVLKVFNVTFPLFIGKIGDIKVLKKSEHPLSLFGKNLPIGIISIKYKDTYKKKISNTKDELVKILNKRIENKITNDNIKPLTTLKDDVIISEKGVTVYKEILCEEEIGKEEEIVLNTAN